MYRFGFEAIMTNQDEVANLDRSKFKSGKILVTGDWKMLPLRWEIISEIKIQWLLILQVGSYLNDNCMK